MQRDDIRLECLKLVFRRDRHPAENVEEAKLYEQYITQELGNISEKGDVTAAKPTVTKSKKLAGNLDAFS